VRDVSAPAKVLLAMGALVLGLVSACSSSAPAAHGTAVTPVVSPAPEAPAGLSLAALQRLRWTALPADPLGPRELAITAWTGRELLAVGGAPITSDGGGFTGADAYDPQTGRWELLPSFPLTARDSPASAWTGYGLVIWGGASALGSRYGLSQALGDGAILDPAKRHWSLLPAGPLPALTGPVAVTDGADQVIILGGVPVTASAGNTPVSRRVASYDPATTTWHSLPDLPAVNGHDLMGVTAVRWGSRVLVAETWQHVVHTVPGATSGNAGVDLFLLDPVQGRWAPFSIPSSVPLVGADLRPLASSLVIGGGSMCPPWASCPATLNSAFTVVDARGQVLSGSAVPPIELRAETDVADSYVVMTGSQITGPDRDEQPGDAAAFDLTTGKWRALPSARRFKPEPESLTWTGRELIALSPNGLIALGPN
jgi:hypothetical protein